MIFKASLELWARNLQRTDKNWSLTPLPQENIHILMHTFLIIKFSIVVINLNNPSLLVDITSISVKKQNKQTKKSPQSQYFLSTYCRFSKVVPGADLQDLFSCMLPELPHGNFCMTMFPSISLPILNPCIQRIQVATSTYSCRGTICIPIMYTYFCLAL